MAYTLLDRTKPDGATQAGTAFGTSTNANDKALEDMIGVGLMQDFAYSQSGGTADEPTTILLTKTGGVIILKLVLVWTSGNITSITPSLSVNSGGAYDAIGSACAITYDGSGNATASTNWGGLLIKVLQNIGKLKAHIAATGTSAHGLGTISTQAATAVNIDGGNIDGTTIGALTPAGGSFLYERETKVPKDSISTATALDWNTAGLFTATVAAGASFTHSNLPNGRVGFITLDLTNAGTVATATLLSGVKWPGGSVQALTAVGRDLVTLMCHDGSTITAVGCLKAIA